MTSGRRSQGLSGHLIRLAPFGAFAGLGTLAAVDGAYLFAGLLGIGAAATGRRAGGTEPRLGVSCTRAKVQFPLGLTPLTLAVIVISTVAPGASV